MPYLGDDQMQCEKDAITVRPLIIQLGGIRVSTYRIFERFFLEKEDMLSYLVFFSPEPIICSQ